MEAVSPRIVVALGATAARSFLGPDFRLTERGGEVLPLPPRIALATVHPSSILRIADREERAAAEHRLVADLAAVPAALRRR